MQTFTVNEKLKSQIHKDVIRKSKLKFLIWGILAVWIIGNIAFIAYAFINPNTMLNQYEGDENYGKKNWFVIWSIFAIINILGPFFVLITKIVVKRITGKDISERINESLFVENRVLEYGYQNYADHSKFDRIIITMPFDMIEAVKVSPRKKEILIKGKSYQRYYDNYELRMTRAEEEYIYREILLYDYFEPSFIDCAVSELGEKIESPQ